MTGLSIIVPAEKNIYLVYIKDLPIIDMISVIMRFVLQTAAAQLCEHARDWIDIPGWINPVATWKTHGPITWTPVALLGATKQY